MKKYVRLAFQGVKAPAYTAASLWVRWYFDQKMLKEIGITQDLKDLSSLDVECFRVIAYEHDRLRNEDLEKRKKKQQPSRTR